MHLHRSDGAVAARTGLSDAQAVLAPTIDPRGELDFSKFATCDQPMFAPANDAALRDASLAALRKHTFAGQ